MKACADLLPVKAPEGPELLPKDDVFVCGRRWDSNHTKFLVCGPGKNVEAILLDGLSLLLPGRNAAVYLRALTLCRVRLDGAELGREAWTTTYPAPGSRMEFLYAPGKGGSGKNVLSSVLSIVVAVAAVWAGPALAGALGLVNSAGALTTVGTIVAAGTTGAIMVAGGWAINSLFPVSQPSLAASQALETGQTYSISGGQNSANLNGYVPLVLGTYRMTPPLGAKSWTMRSGDDQYFNMLVIWGHADVSVTDFRIGETPLSKFSGVTHVFHGSSTGNDLRYFARSYNEQSIGATLDYNVPVTRSVGECDSISVEIAFSALANLSSGSAQATSVNFKIEYALEGTEDWKTFASTSSFHCPAQYVDCYTGASSTDLWATPDGTWHARQSDTDWNNPNWTNGKIQVTDPHFSPYPIESYKDKHKHHEWWTRACDYNAGTVDYVTITGSQSTTLARTFEWAVPHGKYQVRITRLTPDTDDATIQDTGVWNIARAITNKAAFNTPLPVACSELRIKASEELSGYVSDFNALCTSFIPDWNGETWDTAETANPASELRYILTNRHGSYRPWTEAKIDEESFRDFHEFCEQEGFTFNFVCDAEALTWKRLSQIAAAGRGAVTLDNDGKFSIIIDRKGKVPVQMFTPRNSWGLTIQRTFTRSPHALRATFRDASSDYEEQNAYVYADGYDENTATNVVEWECEGKTDWNEVWRFGRYYLASMKLRPETITLSTDWEWRMCRRGDLVAVASDVLTNTFGTARIQRLIYSVGGELVYVGREADIPQDESGADLIPVGVQLDDSVYYSEPSPARYGIAVRLSTGRLATYEVQPKYGEESADLMFLYAIAAAQVPPLGALASVALFGNDNEMEYGEYLVAGITPGDDMSADLTLIPYAPEIMDADTGEIPAWSPPVRLDTIPKRDNLPVPVITETRSDESVLIRSGDSLISCIAAWYKLPSSPDAGLGEIQVQMRAVDGFGHEFTASAPFSAPYITVQGVQDGTAYTVTLRLVSSRGRTSIWSKPVVVVVVGKSSPPPVVEGFTATLRDPEGVLLAWDASKDIDVEAYEVSGDASGKTLDTSLIAAVYGKVGELSFLVVAVDTLGQKSPAPASASVTVQRPKTPVITSARLLDEGVVVLWQDAKTSWSIDRYQLTMGDSSVFSAGLKATMAAASPFAVGQTCTLRAQDIFRNWGEESEPFTISVLYPKTPDIVLGYDKLNGTVTVDWQDCRNAAAGSPAIDRYEIDGTLANQNSKDGLVTVKGTHYEAVVPLTAYEYGSREDEDGTLVNVGTITVSVRAVDKYGISNQDDPNYQNNEIQLSIWPPYNPTDMAIAASEEGDSIILSWKDCTRTFAVAYYLVTDSMTGRTYKVDTNYVVLPPRKAGSYPVTVQAFDVIGHSSAAMTYNMLVAGVGGMTVTAKVDGSDILVEWSIPESAFVVDHYIIRSDNDVLPDAGDINFEDGNLVGTAKVNYIRIPAGKSGQYVFYVWAVDVAGNISTDYASFATVTVEEPGIPAVAAALDGDGVTLNWSLEVTPGQLPVRAWDVVRQWAEGGDETQVREMDYGRLDVNTTTVPAFSAGEHSFMVRAVDSGGNIGPWGFVDFVARAPGKVTFTQPVVIDNNVQLYWSLPSVVFFPIREYIFSELEIYDDGEEYEAEIGRVDALFASESEEVAGTYTYAITPVDVGGNVGQRATITCRVAQPQNFVFYDKKESLFNGTKVNFELDGEGHMLGPVPMAETWEENVARVVEEADLSVSSDALTHEQKADAVFPSWLEPAVASGSYSENIDHGTTIPNCNYKLTMGYRVLSGSPVIECKIEISQNGDVWDVASDNAFSVYVTQFRYSRFTISVSGGYIEISSIYVDLNAKQITDYGRVECGADDNGEGWISETETPMLTGTWVPFNRGFVDVQSLPQPNVVNHQEYTAYTVFEDVINPEGFRIFVKDKNGSRVTATVDWVAMGV